MSVIWYKSYHKTRLFESSAIEKMQTGPLLSAKFLLGIDAFNRQEFFAAHDYFEQDWRRESSEIRALYQGLIQLSAACLHLQRANLNGAHNLLRRALVLFTPFLDSDFGINLISLNKEVSQLNAAVERFLLHPGTQYEMPTFPRILKNRRGS